MVAWGHFSVFLRPSLAVDGRSNRYGSQNPRSVTLDTTYKKWQYCIVEETITAIVNFIIARQHTDARYWYSKYVCLSVCPSVCPSVTFRYQMKTAWHIVIVFSPYGSTIIIKHFYKIPTGSPPTGALNTGGV